MERERRRERERENDTGKGREQGKGIREREKGREKGKARPKFVLKHFNFQGAACPTEPRTAGAGGTSTHTQPQFL